MGDSDLFKSDVFQRTAVDTQEISIPQFNMIIGLVLSWGFLANWIMIKYIPPSSILAIDPIIFFIGYFASCFLGIYLFNSSKNPKVSFIGYNFVVVPFGLIVNIVVSRYQPALVIEAIQITAIVTVIMMIFGTIFPKFFQAIYGPISIALLAMIVIELIQIFVFHHVPEWTDWVVVMIFCGYIGYDWGRALRIPKTVDNAIDSAAAIYMDIINLFLRILRILGRRRR